MGDDSMSSSPSAVDAVDRAGEVGGDAGLDERSPLPSCANALGGGEFVFEGDVLTGTWFGGGSR